VSWPRYSILLGFRFAQALVANVPRRGTDDRSGMQELLCGKRDSLRRALTAHASLKPKQPVAVHGALPSSPRLTNDLQISALEISTNKLNQLRLASCNARAGSCMCSPSRMPPRQVTVKPGSFGTLPHVSGSGFPLPLSPTKPCDATRPTLA